MSDSIKKYFEMKETRQDFTWLYPLDNMMLEVEGYYERGEPSSREYVGSASELRIESIKLHDTEIYDILDPALICEIETRLTEEFDQEW